MSAMAEQARARAKSKVDRLTSKSQGAIDASGWTEPKDMHADSQTGMRVLSRRAYKAGGKVSGEAAKMHMGRKPRKSGGSLTANSLVNRDVKEANEERDGTKFKGGLKTGGRAGKACGGDVKPMVPGRPMTRMGRKAGGRAKKGMNVNIIIAQSPSKPAMPMGMPPGAPPGGPVGLHQGAGAPPPAAPMGPPAGAPPLMGRKSGGRTSYPIESGAGGGLGRLEKARAYG